MLSDRRTDSCMVYTVKEISTMLHTSPAFIYRMISSGMLPALKLGSLRVRKQALENFLEEYEGQDLSDLDHIKPLSIVE